MKTILNFLFGIRETKTSLLALSMAHFTHESHLEQIERQGRMWEYISRK